VLKNNNININAYQRVKEILRLFQLNRIASVLTARLECFAYSAAFIYEH